MATTSTSGYTPNLDYVECLIVGIPTQILAARARSKKLNFNIPLIPFNLISQSPLNILYSIVPPYPCEQHQHK